MPDSRRPLAGLAACVLVASFGTSAANVALPALVTDLSGTFAQAQGVVLGYLIAMTVASLVVGRLGDAYGRGRVLRLGAVLFALAAVAGALSPSLATLTAARSAQGVGAAAMTVLPIAIAKDAAPVGRTGIVLGALGTAAALGTASGPALGGLLVAAGWQAIFWAMAPAAVLVLALLGRTPRPTPSTASASTDGDRLRVRMIAPGMTLNLLVGAVMMSTLVVGPFYLTGALGLPPATVGLAMAAGPVASVCTGVLAGRLVDRADASRMTVAALAVMTAGVLALALLPALWGLPGYLTGTVLLAPGYQLFLVANSTTVLGAVPLRRRGSAAGALTLARNLGLVTGAALLAAVFAAAAGGTDAAPDALVDGLRTTFLVAAALTAAGAAIATASRAPQPVRR